MVKKSFSSDFIHSWLKGSNHYAVYRSELPVRVQADGKKCNFQLAWLEEFPYLLYSKSSNPGFCLPSLFFIVFFCA